MENKAIINCHTHIFTAKDVPPFIARQFIPWPFYYLTYFPFVFGIFNFFNRFRRPLFLFKERRRKVLGWLRSNAISHLIFNILLTLFILNSGYFILDNFNFDFDQYNYYGIIDFITNHSIILTDLPAILKLCIIGLTLISTGGSRKVLWTIMKWIFKPFTYLPKPKTIEFIGRYFKIAAIAKYKAQSTAYNKLYKMYPPGSKFVVLPMDMEFMGAGKPRSYLDQLDELNKMILNKENENYKNIIPFLFVDPRRIRKSIKDGDKLPFFKYSIESNKVILEDSIVRYYLVKQKNNPETGNFRGIKIYPALGYFPFDEDLLPLWLYCAQKGIPITTHCTLGTIFYRGRMKKKWFVHPVFEEPNGNGMEMYSEKNIELQRNFTHPLNYLVLLEPYFLKKHLKQCSKAIQELFGFDPKNDTLVHDLSKLKINIAHYGGIEQWQRHMDTDRSEEAQQITKKPNKGISLVRKEDDDALFMPFKPAWLWRRADWYSIISSMMIQYDNIYADISYILHTPNVKSLLNLTLENKNLLDKVLFGTDYYVVRNHKSEKELYADMIFDFSEEAMHKMARVNGNKFLLWKGARKKILTDIPVDLKNKD